MRLDRRTLRSRLVVCVIATAPVLPSAAFAADPTQAELQNARDLFTQAQKDEDAGSFRSALEKLQRVGAVKMTPGVRYHIARCEENLGMLAAALGDYTKAEDEAKADPANRASRAVLESVAAPLAGLRGRVPRLRVVVPQDVRDVDVTIDGHALPQTMWGELEPIEVGAHRIEATAPSRAPFTTSVTMSERDVTVVEVALAPAIIARPLAPIVHEDEGPSRVAAIASTAGAVAIVAGGFGAFAVAGAKQSDARSACATRTTCDSLRGPVRAWDAIALGAWIGGAAVGTLAVILWANPSHADAHGDPHAALSIDLRGVNLQGSF